MSMRICKCGCGVEFDGFCDYIRNHEKQEVIVCACGCEQKTFKYNQFGREKKYMKGHFIATMNKGKILSAETRQKLSEARMGQIPWNKGLNRFSNEKIRKMSSEAKGYKHTDETRQRMSESKKKLYAEQGHHWVGRKHKLETIEKIRLGRLEMIEKAKQSKDIDGVCNEN